jgi:hypothetical protein
VFVILELGTRKILHHNVTAHPTAEWTLQQFREALPGNHPYRSEARPEDVGNPFQPRQAAHEPGPGNTGGAAAAPRRMGIGIVSPPGHVIRGKAVLGGLHHEYFLGKVAA